MLKIDPQEPNAIPQMDNSVFQWLPTGAEGLDAMLTAIGAATRSVQFEMYIFTAGPLGIRFRDALIEARRRGARVQLLLDAFGAFGLPSNFWNPLVQLGGELRWFNPFRASERYGRRNHRKLLVVDGERAIVGGFNVGEEYYGDGIAQGWRDLGLEIQGPLVVALQRSFETMFAKAAAPLPRFPSLHKVPDTAVHTNRWTLLLSEPGRGHRAFKRALLHDLARACNVQIISAYFVPTFRLRRALMRVARRGGRVQLILAGHSDIELARHASHSLYAKLMRAGVEIYEYQPQILHAKLVIINHTVYVGSANLDARSLNINHELMIRIADRETADKAQAIFKEDLTRCQRIDPGKWQTARNLLTRIMERAAYFLMVRIDPHITSLRLRARAQEAWKKQEKR